MEDRRPHIIIIGAGFGGVELAKGFGNKPVRVTLIDQYNYHNFQPLMYQVATGGLEPNSIAHPARRIIRKYRNVSFRMTLVARIDRERNCIQTSIGELSYDYLILATGSKTNYFNFEPVKDQMLTLKSIPDALDMRSFIFHNLERAAVIKDPVSLSSRLNVAIVGGGPAGIELAGALAEMRSHVIPKDFKGLDTSKMEIHLYESGGELLGAMSKNAQEKSLKYLTEMGVDVHLNSRATEYKDNVLHISDGSTFPTLTVIWTAGVQGAPVPGLPEEAKAPQNRVKVDDYQIVTGTDNIYAVGDVSFQIDEKFIHGLPMLAPVAQQQGDYVVKHLLNRLNGKANDKSFSYFDKGTMATVGRNRAVVDLPTGQSFGGAFAWFIWMFVHIFSIVGFRNKFVAFFDWLTNYISYDQPLGLITRSYNRTLATHDGVDSSEILKPESRETAVERMNQEQERKANLRSTTPAAQQEELEPAE